MTAQTILGGINQEATQQELLGTVAVLLAAMLERMPRVTGNDQCAVSIEAGSVGIASGQTLATLTTLSNIVSIGSKPASTAADAIAMTGAAHIYNNIIVS
jgi:hypothetical protein